jgi:AAA domain
VYRVTETATVLLGGGVVFSRLTEKQAKEFQGNLLRTILTLEETYLALAREDARLGHQAIVLSDRGAMDPSAYMPRAEWLELLEELELTESLLRESRYDHVVHLITAADGAEPYFGSHTNKVRSENLALARQLDRLVAQAWDAHPSRHLIDNSTDFERKQIRTIETILKSLNLSLPPHIDLSSVVAPPISPIQHPA